MTTNDEFPGLDDATSNTTLVVGGGITGLYCAYELHKRGLPVVVAEARDVPGGKIQTEHLQGGEHVYVAEFGPMRFEPNVQPELDRLVAKELELGWVPFDGPVAATPRWPDYGLEGPENTDAMRLLRRGITLALGEHREDEDELRKWLEGLGESHYEQFRQRHHATVPNVLLRDMTLWNALAAPGVLSHRAITKIRDQGTFYHMVHESVNAVEWIIWWLRALKPSASEMKSINGGSAALTNALVRKLGARVLTNLRVLSLREHERGVTVDLRARSGRRQQTFARVVLALPPSGLEPLRPSLPKAIVSNLDTVTAYALLKVFFVVRNPWWKPDTKPQTNASSTPTREIHYQRAKGSDHGMVLVYTDRPAISYWHDYVLGQEHDRPEDGDKTGLVREFARYLAHEVVEARALLAAGQGLSPDHPSLTDEALDTFAALDEDGIAREIEQRVVTTRIRDWGRPPFHGAYHAWKPKVDSTEVIKSLARFGSHGRLHICGEAYSNYQGFIEGALRTANTVVGLIAKATS